MRVLSTCKKQLRSIFTIKTIIIHYKYASDLLIFHQSPSTNYYSSNVQGGQNSSLNRVVACRNNKHTSLETFARNNCLRFLKLCFAIQSVLTQSHILLNRTNAVYILLLQQPSLFLQSKQCTSLIWYLKHPVFNNSPLNTFL